MPRRTINKAGFDLIRNFEGLRLKAYPDPGTGGDPWTVGYGHTGKDVTPGLVITNDRADELLAADLAKFEQGVADLFVQLLQLQTERGLADAQPFGGAGQVSFAGDGDEGAEKLVVHADSYTGTPKAWRSVSRSNATQAFPRPRGRAAALAAASRRWSYKQNQYQALR